MKGNDLRETGGSSAGELGGVEAAINVLYKIRIKTPVEIKKMAVLPKSIYILNRILIRIP